MIRDDIATARVGRPPWHEACNPSEARAFACMLGSIAMPSPTRSPTRPPTRRLHRLGSGSRPLAAAGGFAWPRGIEWDARDARRPLWLWEGVAHGQAAANLAPAEALAPAWREHFEICDALWLLPLLRRMADGERLAWAEVVRAHVAARGAPPEPVAVEPDAAP